MNYQLAQINIAKMFGAIHDPVMADFVANLDRIYELAYQWKGFIWIYKPEENNGTALTIFDDVFLITNLSVWSSTETLYQYVYQSAHGEIFKRRKEWFAKMPEMYLALWYIPEGYKPTADEARERLLYLRNHGETPYAFSFKKKFTEEEAEDYEVINT
jgi:hypothetical protein